MNHADLIQRLNLTADVKTATSITAEQNAAMYSLLDFEDTREYENAVRGLIDAPESLELKDAEGNIVWSQKAYEFTRGCACCPATVNPSLWENTRNNHAYGLFKVVDGIYQVRGYDMTNITFVAGETGWIVFDPLMSVECSKAAMELVEKNLGKRPVKAVIISHPHVDHYGGLKGIMTAEEAADAALPIAEQTASGKIPIIVPKGYAEHAISENLYAGQAMARRASYQYGIYLPQSAEGTMAMGIGMGQSVGFISYINPTWEVTKTGETITVDGVEMIFQMTPGTEAPAEMNTWFPQLKALWMAENCTGTLHNLYTLRGAQVRDGSAWAKYIAEAVALFGKDAEVVFQSHNWPHWGNDTVVEYMTNTAAAYKFINDQTLTYINQGYTSNEIANMIKLPDALEKNWYTRPYYGTVAHDAKAVYQRFMGWYDANPAHLHPVPPEESARKWVEYLGDTDRVLELAKHDFEKGEYRWVAEVTNVLVFADPANTAARLLCADALEQLGYQAESGTWRNAYLTGAMELRMGNRAGTIKEAVADPTIVMNLTSDMMFDYMGIVMDKKVMGEYDITINLDLVDVGETIMLRLKNGAILPHVGMQAENPDISLTGPKNAIFLLMAGQKEMLLQAMKVEGDVELLQKLMASFTEITLGESMRPFNIVEP